MATRFKGLVGGVEYTNPTLFEKAAKGLGFRYGMGRQRKWAIGTAVNVVLNDGTRVPGQVWSMADVGNYCWLALENGAFVAVYMPGRFDREPRVFEFPSSKLRPIGKVAA